MMDVPSDCFLEPNAEMLSLGHRIRCITAAGRPCFRMSFSPSLVFGSLLLFRHHRRSLHCLQLAFSGLLQEKG